MLTFKIALAGLVTSAALTFSASAQDMMKVRIGTEGAYPPFNYIDANGELQGFDVDIAHALCDAMKAECTFVAQDWDGIIPALLANKYDAIIASMSITDERKEVVDFTDHYYTNSLVFAAADDTDITDVSPEGLAGRALGAQSATVAAAFLEDNYGDSTVRLYPTQQEAHADLDNGRIDAVLADFGVHYDWLQGEDGAGHKFVGDAVVGDDVIGIAVRQGDDELREALNKALAQILEDGTYAEINAKYFPFTVY